MSDEEVIQSGRFIFVDGIPVFTPPLVALNFGEVLHMTHDRAYGGAWDAPGAYVVVRKEQAA